MMLGHVLFALDFTRWETWIAPVAGLLAAAAALLVGQWWLRARQFLPPPVPEHRPSSDPFLEGSATERRGSLRRTGKEIKVLVSDLQLKTPPYEGWVMDRSMGGIGLALPREVALSSVINVRVADGGEEAPWVQVQVRRCKCQGSYYEIGCQFVRTPPWAVLLLFG